MISSTKIMHKLVSTQVFQEGQKVTKARRFQYKHHILHSSQSFKVRVESYVPEAIIKWTKYKSYFIQVGRKILPLFSRWLPSRKDSLLHLTLDKGVWHFSSSSPPGIFHLLLLLPPSLLPRRGCCIAIFLTSLRSLFKCHLSSIISHLCYRPTHSDFTFGIPGGPVILHSHCWRARCNPWLGKKEPKSLTVQTKTKF